MTEPKRKKCTKCKEPTAPADEGEEAYHWTNRSDADKILKHGLVEGSWICRYVSDWHGEVCLLIKEVECDWEKRTDHLTWQATAPKHISPDDIEELTVERLEIKLRLSQSQCSHNYNRARDSERREHKLEHKIADLKAQLNGLQKDHGEELAALQARYECFGTEENEWKVAAGEEANAADEARAALAEKGKELADYKDATNISPAAIEEWIKENAKDKKRIEELENAIAGNLSNKRREIGLLDTEIDSFKAKLASAEKVVEAARELLRASKAIQCMVEDPDNLTMQTYDRDFREGKKSVEAALAEHDKDKK